MRKWTFVFAVALAACSGKMPPGPTGRPMELRKYLPDSLKTAPFPPDSSYRQEIVVGPDSARVELTWTTFRHGTGGTCRPSPPVWSSPCVTTVSHSAKCRS
jgi:hypothetical protein